MPFHLVIPTLNAGPMLDELLPKLRRQSALPKTMVIMDSTSDDETPRRFLDFGAEVYGVRRQDFDHGGTRQAAIERLPAGDLVILMTQDALPASDRAFEEILAPFADPMVAVAYGRQLPRGGAGLIESHARLFNYPNISRVDDPGTLRNEGIRATFCSNSFAAYRISALRDVGGFPQGCIFGEDAVASARLLEAGWIKVYVPAATVHHSHAYSIVEEFRRYFDVGVLHGSSDEMRRYASGTPGEGLKFVKSELAYLAARNPLIMFEAAVRTGAKYIGYRAGKAHKSIPDGLKPHLSMNKRFWLT